MFAGYQDCGVVLLSSWGDRRLLSSLITVSLLIAYCHFLKHTAFLSNDLRAMLTETSCCPGQVPRTAACSSVDHAAVVTVAIPEWASHRHGSWG